MSISWIKNFYFPQKVLDFLNIEITPFIDFWMAIHLISGVILYKLFGTNKNGFVLMLLIAYEVFEQYLFQQKLAIPEPLINTLLDILIGYLGYIFATNILELF